MGGGALGVLKLELAVLCDGRGSVDGAGRRPRGYKGRDESPGRGRESRQAHAPFIALTKYRQIAPRPAESPNAGRPRVISSVVPSHSRPSIRPPAPRSDAGLSISAGGALIFRRCRARRASLFAVPPPSGSSRGAAPRPSRNFLHCCCSSMCQSAARRRLTSLRG